MTAFYGKIAFKRASNQTRSHAGDSSRVVGAPTSPIVKQIAAIDDFTRASYEVHVNCSAIVVKEH
ncbi:hypothetical protein [Sphingomonas xinjiangensis]|uniref:Uncharacterized protein n=1 Tax=Sphingomonas xinjiangensis TaxID=643568 RepID=A0A840YRE2_9SPHN|nr:hypothetical protein [Sphingomonas xinjiangensis]MBB5712072.1 hypothetical protein [Sphingomonas xinjiangensis]